MRGVQLAVRLQRVTTWAREGPDETYAIEGLIFWGCGGRWIRTRRRDARWIREREAKARRSHPSDPNRRVRRAS